MTSRAVQLSMQDHYLNFYALSQHEIAGVDFRIQVVRAEGTFALVAPHGGGIEAGTSELAAAIAGDRFSYYLFEGLKKSGNSNLHITSTRFDEPTCLALIGQSDVVVTIHGERGAAGSEEVFVGGADEALAGSIGQALTYSGFHVGQQQDPDLQGLEPCNLCNRGRTARGVQLELSLALRNTMFKGLSREERLETLEPFDRFVAAVSQSLSIRNPT